jgi:acetyl esterase/lipase
MAINKAMLMALKAISNQEIDLKKDYQKRRQFNNATHPYIRNPYKMWDHKVIAGEHEVPVRVFFPDIDKYDGKIMIYFHGGGWVTGSIDSYSNVCRNLSKLTGHIVVSVDYRLAPEHPFPEGLEDCYAVAREIFMDATLFDSKPEDIVLIGDSAGGNLAAVVSLMARDRGEFLPTKQILIYPLVASDHSENSPYPSVHENGADYLLTTRQINDYMELYKTRDEDMESPYVAPILSKDLSNQPRTLIITAEYDPLRDEGEAYGRKLYEFGNDVEVFRMKDAVHGFFSLPKRFIHPKRTYELINRFLEGSETDEANKVE